MKLQVNIENNGQLALETGAKAGEATIDNTPVLFRQVAKGQKHFTVLLHNDSIDVYVLKFDAQAKSATLMVNGKKCTLSASDEMDVLLKKLGMDVGGAKKMKELNAPMPGLVVKIEVEPGQAIKKGQPVVILEAMKMENILKATADAEVQSIEVKTGQAVEKNQVLIKFV